MILAYEGERQEEQAALLAPEHSANGTEVLHHIGAQVPMGEDATLGSSGRSGGVDDGGDVVDGERADPLIERFVRDRAASVDEVAEAAEVDHDGLATGHLVIADSVQQCPHRRRLDDGEDRRAVSEDPMQLLGRRGFIDGHRHRAHRQDRVVQQQPFQTGVRHDDDPFTGHHEGGNQALCQGAYLFEQLGGGHVDEVGALPAGGNHACRVVLGPRHDRLEQVRIRGKR
jgi:hypothetical protein